ncbi:class I glutamine amidotransferase-like protein [Ophiobolus disseminans]|uniref:Class I glutamine amidotransferase-like protein n=1 Tax=Ophiobolus disseminans TaxID=1469910 RepID=A0A6A6ZM38_9PLEO|nr:class I glutamine amidotransferase-like protein [Ophiobolus disseminans]
MHTQQTNVLKLAHHGKRLITSCARSRSHTTFVPTPHRHPPVPQTLHVCALNADTPVTTVHASHGHTYGRIFHSLLTRAMPHIAIQTTDFDVTSLAYPPDMRAFDALIISGSAHSAYDDAPWIRRLDTFIKHVYATHKHVRIFGSCFGHQIICASLLDAPVEPHPLGWEIGVKHVDLTPAFRAAVGYAKETMRLQFIHRDHVVLNELPRGWMSVGSTQQCRVQGVFEASRVLTMQGHCEFDARMCGETVRRYFGGVWGVDRMGQVVRGIEGEDDAGEVVGVVGGFLLGRGEDGG